MQPPSPIMYRIVNRELGHIGHDLILPIYMYMYKVSRWCCGYLTELSIKKEL